MEKWLKGEGAVWLVSLALVSIALFLFGILTDTLVLRVSVKAIPVLVCAVLVWLYRRDTVSYIVVAGLCASAAGDILLELSFKGAFLSGMIAFLVGHVLYAVSFVRQVRTPGLVYFIPYLVWGGCIAWLVWPGMGSLRIPVLIYMTIIVTMMWRATVVVAYVDRARGRATWTIMLLLGALFYGLSDSLIAINKFHHTLENVRPAISLTYWLGQGLISWMTVKLLHVKFIHQEGAGAHHVSDMSR